MIAHAYVPVRPLLFGPRPLSLGQSMPASFRVVVTDPRGVPFRDAQVTIGAQGSLSARTDSSGIAVFDGLGVAREVPGSLNSMFPVRITFGDLSLVRDGSLDQTLFVQIPMCAPQPLLALPELISFAAGTAFIGAGLKWKIRPLQVVGEVLFGAAIFTAVYRHSCST